QLMPFLDLLTHSQRDPNYGNSLWSMPATGWANFLVPLLFCGRSARGVFFQHDQLWTSSYYPGVAPLALSIFAAFRVRTMRVRLLAALALAGVVLAMGDDGYIYKWLRPVVPLLGFVRFPIKFVVLTIFCLPLLTAYAFSWLGALHRTRVAINARDFVEIWIAMLVLMAFVLWLAWRYPFPSDEWGTTCANAVFRAMFFTLFLCL